MNCFNHHEAPAIAHCKHCSKSLCKECYQEVDGCISCKKETCQTNIIELNQMTERSKKIYGIGKYKGRGFNTSGILSLIFGLLFSTLYTFYVFLDLHEGALTYSNFIFVLFGLAFIVHGLWSLLRKDKLNI